MRPSPADVWPGGRSTGRPTPLGLRLAPFLALIGLAAGPVAAQTADPSSSPVILIPPRPETAPPPLPPVQPQPLPIQVAPIQAAPAQPPRGAIEVESLAAIDPSAIGLIDAKSGGLPADLWAGAEKSVVQALIPSLPVAAGSPVMASLVHRLLLTRAGAPEGGAAPGDSLLALKLERLMAAGEVEALAALAPQVANPAGDPKAARILAEALILVDRVADAAALGEIVQRQSADPFWIKLAAFAQARAEDPRADLSLGLARDSDPDDKTYFALMALLAKGGKGRLDRIKEPSILHLALMRALKLAPAREAYDTDQPALIKYWLAQAETDAPTRIALTERLGSQALVEPKVLAELWAALALKEDERLHAVDTAMKAPGLKARAALFQAARTAATTEGQAAAVAAALVLTGDPALTWAMAQANRGIVLSLPPAPMLLPYAGALGRVALLAGDVNAAIRWHDGFASLAAPGSSAAGDLSGLGVLIALADPAGARPLARADLDALIARAQSAPAEQRAARIGVILNALDALGLGAPPDAWRLAVGGAPRALDGAALRALQVAAERGRKGETILLALILLGRDGPAHADPAALGAALSALNRAGLGGEARRLAIEAALAHGA